MKSRILIVDDDPTNLISTQELLQSWGFEVVTAEKPSEAIKIVQTQKEFGVIILDYLMPEMTGGELAEKIHNYDEEASILMYSCDDSRDALKNSIRAGVTAFIDKDEDYNKLKMSIREAITKYESAKTLKGEALNPAIMTELGLIGSSPIMIRIAALAKKFRTMDDPALITGETGTGKELIARALHDPSKGVFLVVNCAGFANSNLVESELFGYEKGAFTGALTRKPGILEIANRGTVFLDELHHLSPSSQATLLRAIREKTIRRVGGSDEIRIHCRIIAATKPNIHENALKGEFLADLYYRLKMLMIEIPPLKERKEDISPLINHFTNLFNSKNKTNKRFLIRTIRALEEYNWPGNIGELQGMVVNLLATSTKNTIEPKDLDCLIERTPDEKEITNYSLEDFDLRQQRDRVKFVQTVVGMSESRTHAAKRLGVGESTLRMFLSRAFS
jgi:two-component system response regulator AtoC